MTLERVASHWVVPPDMHGLRVDLYLQRKIGRISRSRAQKIIEKRDFLIDGQEIKLSRRVRAGQKATLIRFAPDSPDAIKDLLIDVVYEDDGLLVLNKPPGLSMHPSANCLYKTLTYWLRLNRPGQKINPCHRIDKETSGLVICAKDRALEGHVKKLFMRAQVKKTYVAVVEGHLKSPETIAIPLALQRERGLVRIKMIRDPEGKPALTRVRPVIFDANKNRTLVMCRPKTGRQHQIRAHLANAGYPIVGDKLYGHGEQFFDDYCRREQGIEAELVHPRHALHALSLVLRRYGLWMRLKCPIPLDFWELIACAGAY